jgi:FkbH-like protein
MSVPPRGNEDRRGTVKCVVWDLDNTLWDGVLLEGDEVVFREDILNIIYTLDKRGILQSIASRNDTTTAMEKLDQIGIADYFIYPQINWNSKASSIKRIAESINIGLDAIAFIDDQDFERDEVSFSLPMIHCLDPAYIDQILDLPEFSPKFITEDSKIRRQLYLADIERDREEEAFDGPKEAFLASLNMVLSIYPAGEDDLYRAEELTLRTNQLNSTGLTYSFEELAELRKSPTHALLMASLEDKYGSYGNIGLGLVEKNTKSWTIKLLLMSCRVMSRGVGTMLLTHIMRTAKENGVRLMAEFVPNDRNRLMEITYRFAGFQEIETTGDLVLLEHGLDDPQPFPDYVTTYILDAQPNQMK